ncbi:serine--tRNA ligase [Borrelia miyamotoi]|uniref:Serine--tRNA ligase n=1 Tax=Borrelia miyamotoi TaxID=47466 RepID=A0AAQ3AH63_9SPIR|nr:serine--tRNA ligase [Borrelia miyamotoi]AGT27218.1 seryl-tRNA synthetase [Borrelia miyamotoi LB-2001]AJA58406.1 seryl-tRNA synthetase [Borrelia miyamotoi]AOW95483.1 serine--tRNA ligase [Borrelia miyamotoi]QTL83370.1 serine--tRNA ligase [Borrelia miyamotoi]WAZ85334.1 serine--tRNA ligase [Borrelia miyamotoi]
MLDLKFIRENLEVIQKNIKDRGQKLNLDLLIALDDERRKLITKIGELNAMRNENAHAMKGNMDDSQRHYLIKIGKDLKAEITDLEDKLGHIASRLLIEHKKIPNIVAPDVPVGDSKDGGVVLKVSGKIPEFDFKAKDHLEIGVALDLFDFERAREVSGNKFYYLKNEAVFLEIALINFALNKLKFKGFDLFITPDVAREFIVDGIGFNPSGNESNIYKIEDTDKYLVGTAEITLGGYYYDTILDLKSPLRMAGLSHCFRKEAGGAGQFSKGLYRVHQFSKVEMFCLCKSGDSERIHDEFLELEEEIFTELEIPYRVLNVCSFDLGAPAYKKYDIEAWMPGRGGGRGEYGEVTSTSNCTDYQSRRLKIRYKEDGQNRFVHMVNGTAIASTRTIIAILENFQDKRGGVRIPDNLVKYTGFDYIFPKN